MKGFWVWFLLAALMASGLSTAAADTGTEVTALSVFYATSRPMNEHTEKTRQFIEDSLGVDVQLIQGDGSAFTQQLALYISSGTMPDVVWTSYDVWNEYAREGAYADIASYLSDYPTLEAYVGEANWKYMALDGATYGVPSMLSMPSGHVVGIRKDWLDHLGLAIPETLDDYTEVMRAFTFNDPDGNGQNDTYGLSAAGYSYFSPFFGAFGATSEQQYFLNEDGSIMTNAISQAYKAGLSYLRDCYAEGLIDPELFTCTYEQAQAKWGRGTMGIWPAWWSHTGNAYTRFDFGSLQPNAQVEILPPPVGTDGSSGVLYAAQFSSVVGISYLCDEAKIRAALKYLDFQASPYGFLTVMYGLEGEYFEWDSQANALTWCWSVNGKTKSGAEVTDMEVYKMLYNERLQAQSYMLSDTPGNVVRYKASEMRFNEPVREDVFALFKTDAHKEYNSELTTYFQQSMISFIMGDLNLDSDWDKYVSTYLSMGGEEVRQSLLAEYSALHGTNAAFAE